MDSRPNAAPSATSAGDLADATIVFDLDGTLVDTAPDLARALNETLDLEGLPRISLDQVRRYVGHGAKKLIERGAGLSGVSFSEVRLTQLTDAYIEFYRADIARESKPFPGALEALAALAAAGAKLSICTNKRTDLSLQLLEALGILDRFSAVVGADAVANKKPDPEHYRAAVDRAGGFLRRSLMVGDTAADMGAARGAGAPVALVSFGYGEDDAGRLGPDALIRDYGELEAVCRRLLPPAL